MYGLGRGQYGRLGLGDNTNVDVPTKIQGLSDISRVSAGSSVSFAVSKSGKAYGWGEGTNLQLTTGMLFISMRCVQFLLQTFYIIISLFNHYNSRWPRQRRLCHDRVSSSIPMHMSR